ncbi:MAG: hypothetical protein JHC33_05560, partial [Ignisphaera sp.]|nr:hypothetical protein [Ignisphaera sp.]
MLIYSKASYATFILILVTLFSTLSFLVYASVFTYRWLYGYVNVYPPTVYFSDPGTPGVSVSLENQGTKATATVNVPGLDIVLDKRSAIFFDTFDSDPFTAGNMTAVSCTWGWDPTTKAINISANSQGPSQYGYECIAVANIDISQYVATGRRVFIATLVWRSEFVPGNQLVGNPYAYFDTIYLGIYPRGPKLYTIGFENYLQVNRTGDQISSWIWYWTGSSWVSIANKSLGISTTLEYYFLSYIVSWIDFSAWRAYHWNQTVLNQASIGSKYKFRPSQVGIGYLTSTTDVTGTVYFDNLVVTVDAYPWLVNVTNVPPGWRVVLKNATGYVVSQAVADSSGVASLNVAPPKVDLSVYPNYRDGFIIAGGTIEVYDDKGNLVVSKKFDYVVGGDVYRLNGFRGNVLRVDSTSTQPFQSYLVLTRYTDCSNSYVWLYLVNTSSTLSSPITIYRGSPTSTQTSILIMRSVNGVAGYIY